MSKEWNERNHLNYINVGIFKILLGKQHNCLSFIEKYFGPGCTVPGAWGFPLSCHGKLGTKLNLPLKTILKINEFENILLTFVRGNKQYSG